MKAPVFIGHELAAAGYRLAGVEIADCSAASARTLFDRVVVTRPPLILIGESCVETIGEARLFAAIANANPPVLIVADHPAKVFQDALPDIIRQELGVTT